MKQEKTLIVCGLLLLTVIVIIGIYLLPGMTRCDVKVSQCNQNLIRLHEAQQNWLTESEKPRSYVPTWDDLQEQLKQYPDRPGWTNGRPVCPNGGTYLLAPMGEWPRCSIGGRDHNYGRFTNCEGVRP